MKKIFRASQIKDVLEFPIGGLDMYKYGLPYDGASGVFYPELDPDSIDLMLAAAERYFPAIHITSTMEDGRILNRYVEDAKYYQLYPGNTDPDIEFTTEFDDNDYKQEELDRYRKRREEYDKNPPDAVEIAAMNWIFQKIAKQQSRK